MREQTTYFESNTIPVELRIDLTSFIRYILVGAGGVKTPFLSDTPAGERPADPDQKASLKFSV